MVLTFALGITIVTIIDQCCGGAHYFRHHVEKIIDLKLSRVQVYINIIQ